MGRPTIRDVAARLGVNPSTVSRAFNRPDRVTRALRERIVETAAEMGYQPNVAAQVLNTKVSQLVPLIVPSIDSPFYSALAASLERVVRERELYVMLCSTNDDEHQEREFLRSLVPFQPPFLIVAPVSDANFILLEELSKTVPLVLVGRVTADCGLPSVAVDHRLAADIAFAHLAELGHSSIAAVRGPAGIATAEQWVDGYLIAANEARMQPEIITGGVTFQAGQIAARGWLSQVRRPTALMVADDLVAVGIASELGNAGVQVPGEVSIVGYDGLDITLHTAPPLTTVAEPLGDIARVAVELADSLKQQSTVERSAHPALVPKLLVRGSTGPPNTLRR